MDSVINNVHMKSANGNLSLPFSQFCSSFCGINEPIRHFYVRFLNLFALIESFRANFTETQIVKLHLWIGSFGRTNENPKVGEERREGNMNRLGVMKVYHAALFASFQPFDSESDKSNYES